jgi:hypothetical protein
MAASDYVPIFFKNRLHLAGRPQMSTAPGKTPRFAAQPSAHLHRQSDRRIRYMLASSLEALLAETMRGRNVKLQKRMPAKAMVATACYTAL